MKVAFRVDSGAQIGIGHLMRCFTLARELASRNYEIHFISKKHDGCLQDYPTNYKVHWIEVKSQRNSLMTKYESWLGESWAEDLNKTNNVLSHISNVDLVVLDHYALGQEYETKLNCKKVMVIDDLMDKVHRCDLLLNQNINAKPEKYVSLLEPGATILLGTRYALLRKEFSELRSSLSIEEVRPIKKILVSFGGTDIRSDCLKLAKAILPAFADKYAFTFILNNDHKTFKELSELLSFHPNTKLLSRTDHFGKIMIEHDLFIGSGGSTTWERACLGVASAIICVAENQIEICEEISKKGLSYFLGYSQFISEKDWQNFFEYKVPDITMWSNFRKKSFQVIDGLGTCRVADKIQQVVEQ